MLDCYINNGKTIFSIASTAGLDKIRNITLNIPIRVSQKENYEALPLSRQSKCYESVENINVDMGKEDKFSPK
jgi:hypothetical protein